MSRSEARIVVDCDACGRASIEVEMTALAAHGWDLADLLRKNEWTPGQPQASGAAQDDVCPDCTEKQQRKEAALWPPNQLPERRTS